MSNFFEEYYHSAHKKPGYVATGLNFDIARNIEQLMKEQNLTNSELAEKLGCSKANVTKLLKGDANLTVNTIAKIAIALDSEIKIAFIHKVKYKELERAIAEFYKAYSVANDERKRSNSWLTKLKSCNDETYSKPSKKKLAGKENAQLCIA